MSNIWTDEQKEEVKNLYLEMLQKFETDEEKANNSVEVVAEIAEKFDKTVNGIRLVLVNAGVYVKKTAKPTSTNTSSSSAAKRLNKAEAQANLKSAIKTIDEELVNDEIIDRMTGKAAVYFTEVIHTLIASEE